MIKLSEMRKGYTKVTAPAAVESGMIGKTIKKINCVGTPIPREGYLGVLFCNNKGLTIAETIEIIDNILDQHTSDTYVAAIIAHYDTNGNITTSRSILSISRENGEHRIWIAGLYNNNIYIFSSRYGGWTMYGGALFEDYAVGGQLVDEQTDEHQSYYLNDQLINLISPTPFEETIEYEILENIDGVSEVSNWTPLPIKKTVTETSKVPVESWKGTPVPNSGTFTKVCVNNNLSIEEVKNIVAKLELGEDFGQYIVSSNADGNNAITVAVGNDEVGILAIINNEEIPIFASFEGIGFDFVGFNPEITNFNLDVNYESVSEIDGMEVGVKNDLLSSLISITPFEKEILGYETVTTTTEIEEWFPIHESNSSYSHAATIELKDIDNIHNVTYELINNDPALFAKYGFAIADVTYRTTKVVYDIHHYAYVTDAILTICSIGCPTEDIELLISVEV